MATQIRISTPLGKVLAELRDGPRTVDEIATALKLTANAVRNQLRTLVSLNLAEIAGRRPGISKPSLLYSITLDGEIQFSTLYLPVLSQFMRVAEGQCSGRQLSAWMAETGRAIGKRYPKPGGNTRHRVDAAARLLASFGGTPDVRARNGSFVMRSASCPLSALTSEEPAVCHIIQNVLHEYIGNPIKICCTRGEDPRCCFEVEA